VSSHRSRPGPPSGPTPDRGAPRRRRTGVLAATAVLVLGLDLVSKVLVVAKLMHRPPVKLPGDFLWLVHARNPGAAFSFAEGATVVFTAVAAIVIAVIVRTASKLRSTAWAISLGLVLGGAAGNLVDRLFRSPAPLRGWVVDWISLRAPDGRMLFPIFNLADSGIVCGGILAVLLALLGFEMDGTRGGKDQPVAGPDLATPPAGQPGPAGPPAPQPGPPVRQPGSGDPTQRSLGTYVPSSHPTADPASRPVASPGSAGMAPGRRPIHHPAGPAPGWRPVAGTPDEDGRGGALPPGGWQVAPEGSGGLGG
jgi:signal peptidase II